jgi:type IV pilus assembly protein PilP
MTLPRIASVSLVLLALGGCSASGEDELREWMASERAQARPRDAVDRAETVPASGL